ncbi:hypothetical protein MLPF_1836 [Mycobacterium lepromatosis]|nr:hypothetical protein MLPF_1836 [Mycobacterium lepromatosis]
MTKEDPKVHAMQTGIDAQRRSGDANRAEAMT